MDLGQHSLSIRDILIELLDYLLKIFANTAVLLDVVFELVEERGINHWRSHLEQVAASWKW